MHVVKLTVNESHNFSRLYCLQDTAQIAEERCATKCYCQGF